MRASDESRIVFTRLIERDTVSPPTKNFQVSVESIRGALSAANMVSD